MSVYSKFLQIAFGAARQVDLSQNTLALLALQLNGATSGNLTHMASAITTSYSLTWPGAQGAGFLSNNGSGVLSWVAGATGTVTSVAFADASTTPIYGISGSPVTTSGTLTQTLINQNANVVFAGPTSGGAAQPSFRSLVSADIPSLSALYLPLTGGTMSGSINMGTNSITNMASPVNPNDAVTKAYVDNFINATSWKTAVLVASTGSNLTLSGEQTIDGVLTSASRILVKDQSSPAQNGIYVTAAGAWSRSIDMSTWAEVPAAAVFVESGTVNADLGFVCTAQPGGTLGTTAINFVQFSSAGSYSADNVTLQLVSGVFSIKNLGVGTAQLGANVVTLAKLATSGITDGVTLDQSGAGGTFEIKALGVGTAQLAAAAVTAPKLGAVTDGITADQNGAGSTIEVLNAPALKRTLIAGQTFTANTSYAVRWGLTANGETAGRIYAADITTSSFDLFYVIGMASSATTVSAGGTIVVTIHGPFALSSADTAFASGTDGAPLFLTASGSFSPTAPSTSGQAITRIGMIQIRSATNTSCIVDVNPAPVGVN